jgi:hypothetical protein
LKPNLELYEANHFPSREKSHLQLKLRIHEMFAAIIRQLATVNFQVQNLTPHLIPYWFLAQNVSNQSQRAAVKSSRQKVEKHQ